MYLETLIPVSAKMLFSLAAGRFRQGTKWLVQGDYAVPKTQKNYCFALIYDSY